jgi:class 3 adenylate cyclase
VSISTPRRNAPLLGVLRAAAIAALVWMAMAGMQARPSVLVAAFAIGAGALALVSPEVGILVAIAGLCLPILAVNAIVGIVLLIALFAAERYLGGGGAEEFMLIGLAIIGVFFGPAWAAAALAGYLLGPATGALAAIVACLAIELIGILNGQPAIGVLATGGHLPAQLNFAHAPATLLSADWIGATVKAISPDAMKSLGATFAHIGTPMALLVQPTLWALGAVVAGAIKQRAGARPAIWLPLAGVAGAIGLLWGGDALTHAMTGTSSASSIGALVWSLVVALGVVAALETVFSAVPVKGRAAGPHPATMATEDADVDELLRLIATAEDQLASKHTSNRVVLITDMKSFSRATEEDGSMATAKAIQRHRDLLVPIINANHGCGKSTGGDGIVAAFESPADAIKAAVDGQKALRAHNATHQNEREIWVRMGLASGEVVLDNGGRPFIGAGLNLAARVMNLADGGQVFAAADVASAAPQAGARGVSFGPFELKNIASPVDVSEMLWADDQQPRDPRTQADEA